LRGAWWRWELERWFLIVGLAGSGRGNRTVSVDTLLCEYLRYTCTHKHALDVSIKNAGISY
jgi:hypothetical protein